MNCGSLLVTSDDAISGKCHIKISIQFVSISSAGIPHEVSLFGQLDVMPKVGIGWPSHQVPSPTLQNCNFPAADFVMSYEKSFSIFIVLNLGMAQSTRVSIWNRVWIQTKYAHCRPMHYLEKRRKDYVAQHQNERNINPADTDLWGRARTIDLSWGS